MGMSVHRAIFDFIFAPDITNNKNLEDVSAIHEQLVRGFGHKSIQQINEEDCRIYAERRRSELALLWQIFRRAGIFGIPAARFA